MQDTKTLNNAIAINFYIFLFGSSSVDFSLVINLFITYSFNIISQLVFKYN